MRVVFFSLLFAKRSVEMFVPGDGSGFRIASQAGG